MSYAQFLYLLHSASNRAVKIGVSVAPEMRLKEIQKSHGRPVNLIAQKRCDAVWTERKILRELQAYRLHGEWLEDCPEVRAALQRVFKSVPLHTETLSGIPNG